MGEWYGLIVVVGSGIILYGVGFASGWRARANDERRLADTIRPMPTLQINDLPPRVVLRHQPGSLQPGQIVSVPFPYNWNDTPGQRAHDAAMRAHASYEIQRRREQVRRARGGPMPTFTGTEPEDL